VGAVKDECPWTDCVAAEIMTAAVWSADGKLKVLKACPDHLPYEVEAVVSGLRLSPPDMK